MTEWAITQKPSFLTDILALPPKEIAQVQRKLKLLADDPFPDGKIKKKLKGLGGKLHRLRCGDYRLFYTFSEPFISLLALRRRNEATYDEDIDPILLGGAPDVETRSQASLTSPQVDWTAYALDQQRQAQVPLPAPITSELLERLLVPNGLHSRLLSISTQEDLLDCLGVPEDYILRIYDALVERPLREVADQPDLVANEVDDLFRYKTGDLPGFLLKLSPAQRALVNFNIDGSSPTVVKGGPGSGKSTVALYRAAECVQRAPGHGNQDPKVLFTTYTNALVRVSTGLIKVLLPEHPDAVEVATADSLVKRVIEAAGQSFRPATPEQELNALREALKAESSGANVLERRKFRSGLDRFSEAYLLDEICSVIQARRIATLQDYLADERVGRREQLDEAERMYIWRISAAFADRLVRSGVETWSQLRLKAEELAARGRVPQTYEAVIIDEVQDLEPAVTSLLCHLCRRPGGLFLTADAGQSIYRSGFNWAEVLRTLKIETIVAELEGNYRSTREIDLAARSCFGSDEAITPLEAFAHEGALPIVWDIRDADDEAAVLARFFRGATKDLRLTTSSCAVLTTTEKRGQALARSLANAGLHATFMPGRDLDIQAEGIKVLPLRSAKGLEFPIVAVAGLLPPYPFLPKGIGKQEETEILDLERRALFVAMTRAMRALLVARPLRSELLHLSGVGSELWTIRP